MARPRQPVDLLVFKGKKNLTKKEIEDRKSQEVKAASDKVRPPAYLSKELKREFKKIADELLRIGIMTNLDINALVLYVESYENYRFLNEKLKELKEAEEFDINTFSQYAVEVDRAKKQCRAFASDLGLSISSRCRLVIPKNEEKQKTEEEILFGDV
jgi:P27 family predicted phage terminase small subunit